MCKRVVALCDAGHSSCEVVKVMGVSESWIRRLKQRRCELDTIDPLEAGGRRHGHFDDHQLERLHHWLQLDPGATLETWQERVADEMNMQCSLMAMCRAIKKLGWSLKKKRFEPVNKTGYTSSGKE